MLEKDATLILIGTVHRDSNGAERLQTLLEELHPQVLTLEMSEVSLRNRQLHTAWRQKRLARALAHLAEERRVPVATLQMHPAVQAIAALLESPFEYRAASAYAERFGVALELIDQPAVARRKLRSIDDELLTRRNLRVLLDLPVPERDEPIEGYRLARSLLFGSKTEALRQAFLAGRRGAEGVGPRDRRMAETIRKRLAAQPQQRLVHVGGWVHLLADEAGETLFSRLRDLAPQRILLDG